MAAQPEPLFLGLDSSTQSLKATLVDRHLAVLNETAIVFDTDLPHFRTQGGAHRGADGLTVTSPVLLWVEALDLLLARLAAEKWPLARVAACSVSGQQHGSVWFGRGARARLAGLQTGQSLRAQLADAFALADCPIWMDSSTTAECRAREAAIGGAQAVADLTGSRAYERFTGNQIAKLARTRPDVYAATERIALVSSFLPSLLIGDYAPIDHSDGSGMNLLDIRRRDWAPAALDCTAPELGTRLGTPAPSHQVVGRLHPYFQSFGFAPTALVVAGSGDNPCSLAGLRLQRTGDLAISLGTSDTLFGALSEPRPSGVEGHIFVNPVLPDAYMAMICYKNGSLTREYVRNELCRLGDWDAFNALVDTTRPGNEGCVGFYIRDPEITPPILTPGIRRFNGRGQRVESFDSPARDARAVLEGQFLSMRLHAAGIGLRPATILATGGASRNRGVLRVMADVFGASVYTAPRTGSASLGAAYRALHGWACAQAGRFVPFAEALPAAGDLRLAAQPDAAAAAVYTPMLERYARLEAKVLNEA